MPRKELVRGGISIFGGLAMWERFARLLLDNSMIEETLKSLGR